MISAADLGGHAWSTGIWGMAIADILGIAAEDLLGPDGSHADDHGAMRRVRVMFHAHLRTTHAFGELLQACADLLDWAERADVSPDVKYAIQGNIASSGPGQTARTLTLRADDQFRERPTNEKGGD